LEYAQEYSQYGTVLDVNMQDSRWSADDGWVEMEISGIEVHHDYNVRTGESDDFKIKDRMESN
jgi:hypothetical protein